MRLFFDIDYWVCECGYIILDTEYLLIRCDLPCPHCQVRAISSYAFKEKEERIC